MTNPFDFDGQQRTPGIAEAIMAAAPTHWRERKLPTVDHTSTDGEVKAWIAAHNALDHQWGYPHHRVITTLFNALHEVHRTRLEFQAYAEKHEGAIHHGGPVQHG